MKKRIAIATRPHRRRRARRGAAGPGRRTCARRPQGRGSVTASPCSARLHHAKEELDLSDQQTDQIKAIFAEARAQNAQYREQLHGGYSNVAKTLLANPNDVAAAQALVDQQTAAERALKTNILNAASKALAVLNAEQRAKLGTMLEKHAEKHRGAPRWTRHGR